jgi:membrane protease subunit (stomatin/prohibitin family)
LIKVEVAIFNVWETKKDNFLFVCLTNKQTPNKNGGTVINSNLIIDVSTGKIRESAFTFGPYQYYLIDCYNLGAYSMFRTFKFEDNKIIKTPTYYVDNQTEKIVA